MVLINGLLFGQGFIYIAKRKDRLRKKRKKKKEKKGEKKKVHDQRNGAMMCTGSQPLAAASTHIYTVFMDNKNLIFILVFMHYLPLSSFDCCASVMRIKGSHLFYA